MSVKTVEATLELLTLAHEVVLLRKERAEATVLMEQAADDLERLKAENARLQAGGCALPSDGRAEGLVKASELFALSADRDRLTAEVERLNSELLQRDMTWLPAKDAEIERLRAALRGAYEVYAGSDGFIPETAAEGYQQQIIKQMVDCISAALKEPRT